MPEPGQGYDSYTSFIEEVTFGTDPGGARDFYLRHVRDTMKKNRNWQKFPGMAGPGIRKRFPGNKVVGGEVEPEFHYEGLGKLFYWALGTGSYTYSVDTPVASANTHEIKAASDQVLPSFSMEIQKGDTPSGKVTLYTGCMIDQLLLEWANQALVKLVMTIVAQEEAPNTTAVGSPSFASDHPVLWHNMGTITIAAVSAIAMKSGRLLINNNLQKDRFRMSKVTAQPLRADNREITGDCIAEFDGVEEYNAWEAETEGALAIALTSEDMVTGATPYSLALASSASQFSTVEHNVEGPGPIDLPLAWHLAGYNEELTATFVNAATDLS
jgi:hypothetical protein